ncbi:MAG: hypothetical protein K0Q76_4058 [Panacagrimonas sp.]|jgi:hypothetical protein|nr:hypothetical protein [Panacagrimonas sp.]MCC2658950.1 hypothetical protein [Panacagrimonas sp.]MDF3020061.1 hypothetical protein [Steroidobacteraceae bacterium]
MITIEHLEVQFDVAGEGDEQVFARYFARYINQWQRIERQEELQKQRLRRDQRIGDDGSYA